MLHYIRPFHNGDYGRITGYLCQFVSNDAGLVQPVKIKMVDLQPIGLIYLANGKRRAGDPVSAAKSAHQTADEGSLAATQVADQLNNLTAL